MQCRLEIEKPVNQEKRRNIEQRMDNAVECVYERRDRRVECVEKGVIEHQESRQ
jgi:hypothetical protein